MSVGDKIVFICVIYLSYKVVLTGCEVVLVNRNVTDSFRVGKGGCKNDSNVCPSSSTCQRDSGLCLCGRLPNFRNPVVENINGYKCVSSQEIIAGLNGFGLHCGFEPFQLIPYSHNEPAIAFTQARKMTNCSLHKKHKTQAKFPNITNNMELEWLNDSYVQFSVSNNILYFKWKRSVPGLQGAIITLFIWCKQGNSYRTSCLRAKVFGTWPPEVVRGTTKSTVISKQPSSSQKITKPALPVTIMTNATAKPKVVLVTTEPTVHTTVMTMATAKPKLRKFYPSPKIHPTFTERSDENDAITALIAAFVVSLIVIVVLGIVVAFLWNKMKRMQNNDLTSKEMKNIGEQGKENKENEINTDDGVETDRGEHNEGIYDDSLPSSVQNNNASTSDHEYEETSNYEPLRKNPLQDQSDEHDYQSLTTSQKENDFSIYTV